MQSETRASMIAFRVPPPPPGQRGRWLYAELRRAILEKALKPGAALPSSRGLARQYGLARGTVLGVYEQLATEGYLETLARSGTRVSRHLPDRWQNVKMSRSAAKTPPMAMMGATVGVESPFAFGTPGATARAFRPMQPAVAEFPAALWARLTRRRIRLSATSLFAEGEVQGFRQLREAIAAHLGMTRGVACEAEQIAVVSGAQQALDLLGRILLSPGDRVWVEDPGYLGAVAAFNNVQARIVPVPVDEEGMVVATGRKMAPGARLAYVTPAHQMPLGLTLSLARRMELLTWARDARAYIIEDDYDSEYRFRGQPVGALKSLDHDDRVILLGSFSKLLFPALRLGYVVLPTALVDPFLRLRSIVDRYSPSITQAVLCDFLTEGHFGQHLRRMRLIYADRLEALTRQLHVHAGKYIHFKPTPAGLQAPVFLRGGGKDTLLSKRAAELYDLDLMPLSRFAHGPAELNGFLLGFAAFPPRTIASGAARLGAMLRG